ncbi:hypothetical protein [Shewanella maritima]|uniref:hypothetical protein n=1 Tax=Shewanella maritima TaxID=2520507 RepID=UPI00373655A6
MNKAVIGLLVATVSFSTVAQESIEQHHLDIAMEQLEQVEASIVVLDSGDQDHITFTALTAPRFRDVYVNHEAAKELELKVTKHFLVQNQHNVESLADAIATQIEVDNPTFFSVKMHREYNRINGHYKLGAKVYEYQ